jgi:hypothetical protein
MELAFNNYLLNGWMNKMNGWVNTNPVIRDERQSYLPSWVRKPKLRSV